LVSQGDKENVNAAAFLKTTLAFAFVAPFLMTNVKFGRQIYESFIAEMCL